MAAAPDREERADVFAAAAALYAVVGLVTGALIALVAVVLAGTVLDGALADDARAGGLGLGALTAVGIAASVHLDGLRAERMFPTAAGAEIAAVVLYLALMVALILADADLALIIALSGALPLLSGLICAGLVRRARLPFRLVRAGSSRRHRAAIVPTAGWLLVIELSNLTMYASGRIVLGAYRTPTAVGLYEGPVRAHNLLYALGRRARRAHRPDRVALRGRRRPAPPARARGPRQPLHARPVRPPGGDADGAGRADRRRVARRALHGRRDGAHGARLLLGPVRRADRDARASWRASARRAPRVSRSRAPPR